MRRSTSCRGCSVVTSLGWCLRREKAGGIKLTVKSLLWNKKYIPVDEETYRKIDKLAKIKGMSYSEFIKHVIDQFYSWRMFLTKEELE